MKLRCEMLNFTKCCDVKLMFLNYKCPLGVIYLIAFLMVELTPQVL